MKREINFDEIYISTFIDQKKTIKINDALIFLFLGVIIYYSLRYVTSGSEHEDSILENFKLMIVTLLLLYLTLKENPINLRIVMFCWNYIVIVLVNFASVLIAFQIMYFFVEFSILVLKTTFFFKITNDFLIQLIIIIFLGYPIYKFLIAIASKYKEVDKIYNRRLYKIFSFFIYLISVLLLGNELYGGIITASFFEEKKTIVIMIMLILPYLDLLKRYG